jgi:hypothetical protein
MSVTAALKTDPLSPEGVPKLASAVHDYRATFDHTMSEQNLGDRSEIQAGTVPG